MANSPSLSPCGRGWPPNGGRVRGAFAEGTLIRHASHDTFSRKGRRRKNYPLTPANLSNAPSNTSSRFAKQKRTTVLTGFSA